MALIGEREKTIDAGCNDYITKLIKRDQLIVLIQKYFGQNKILIIFGSEIKVIKKCPAIRKAFFCPFPPPPCLISLLEKEDYGRYTNHQAQYDVKETPDGKQATFSIKFVNKKGELIFIPKAVAVGLRFNMKENRMRGVLAVDANNDAIVHVTPVHIDGIIEWNGKKIKM